jgi:tetratricopeptide (TPR) repeat protein
MEEQQARQYLELIHSLLTCEAGTEGAVYQQYSQLVDEILPKLMVHIAEQYEQAEEPQDMAWLRQEAARLSERIDEWNRLNRRVMELHEQGNLPMGIKIAEQALELAEAIFPSPNSNLAASLNNLAGLYQAKGEYDQAEPLHLRVLKINEASLGEDHPFVATTLNNLAELYKAKGKYDRAEPLYLRALKINEASLGKDHPDVATILNNLAVLYQAKSENDRAEPLHLSALKIREASLGKDHPDVAMTLNNLAVLYEAKGEYDPTEPLYVRALKIRETKLGKDHPLVATTLNDLAGLYAAKGEYDSAEPLYVRALKIRETKLGKDHPLVATTLNDLAGLYAAKGEYDSAEPLHLSALKIREASLGKDHPDVAMTLKNLAVLYEAKGEYDPAEPLYVRALKIWETKLGEDHPFVTTTLNNLAELYKAKGEYDSAEPLHLRALAIKEASLGKDHPSVATTLNNLAELYRAKGEHDRAEPLYLRALKIQEASLGKDHPDVVTTLNNLAELYRAKCEYDRAEPLYLRALAIKEASLGKDHPSVATTLNNLAVLYQAKSEYDRAEPLYLRSLKIDEASLGKDHRSVAMTLNNLAELYRAKGEYDRAEPLYLRSLKINEASLGKDHPDVATTLNNLAELYKVKGEYDRAEPLCLRSLKIRETKLGKDHPDVATTLDNLAGLHKFKGEYDPAEPLYLRALKIRETKLGKDHHYVAMTLDNLAILYQAKGEYDRAEPLYLRSLKIREALFGKAGHPNLVGTLTNLALTYAKQRKIALALPLLQQAIDIENLWLTNVLAINDTEQRLKELDRRQPQIEYLLALTQQSFPNDPAAITAAFNAVLSRKAQGLTAEAAFSRALRDRPELTPQIQAYRQCQQEIVNLVHRLPTQPQLQERFDTLLQHRSDLQKNLARSIPAVDLAQQVIDRQALTELLPAGAFLVEFVRYRDVDFIKGKEKAARYIAFILIPDSKGVTAIDCGLAEPLDLAIAKFRRVFADSDFSGERSCMEDMFDRPAPVPEPEDPTLPDLLTLLLPHIPNSGTCYLAPDGDLHLLPFHLLKTSDGNYLSDRYHLHHLTTARDLYRQNFPTSTNPPAIFADPDYDGGTLATLATSDQSGEQKSHDVCGKPFDRLKINEILGKAIATAYQVPWYTDIEATVDRLERLKAPQLLAIATHGFMFPAQQDLIEQLLRCSIEAEAKVLLDRRNEITPEFRDFWHQAAADGTKWCQRILDKIDKIGIHTPEPTTANSIDLLRTPTTDPMLRSGIALAGANIWRFQGTETEQFGKGVVFAHDIAQWDLWGTELALMITCVSGLGAIKNSEGVFGLRRALAIAGAKYVITSLWSIPTKPSVLLMNKFFELYRSAARPTPPQALAQAQNYVRNITLRELKELEIGLAIVEELQGETVRKLSLTATDDVKPLADPHYWGAWICQG